jgi:hypothetical protein
MTEIYGLDFDAANPMPIHQIVESYERGDALGFVMKAENTNSQLAFVFDNIRLLQKKGIYEECLVHAYNGCKTNFAGWDTGAIHALFDLTDRKKLLSAGDELPGSGPFKVYRGIAGRRGKRSVHGFSWTYNMGTVC